MNKQSRRVYIKRHMVAMKLLEQNAHKLVLRCYRRQRPRVLEFVLSGYSLDELPDHTKQFYEDSIKPLWKATLKQIWNNAAQEAEGNIKEWLAPNAVKKDWEDSADAWMQENAGAKIDGITDTDQQWLANTLRSGESEGKTPTEMASDLQDSFDNMSAGRAGTIARTETAGAYNFASLDTAQDIMPDGSTKVWEVTSDNPRPWHEEADGQEVPIDEPFDVDGEDMDYPGDPNGSAENVVNCMCVVSYNYPTEAAPGEEEGVPEAEGEGSAPAEEGVQIEGLSGAFANDTEQSILALRDDPLFKELDIEPKIIAEEADTERKMYFAKGLDYENLYANPNFDRDNYQLSYDIGHAMIQEGTTPDLMSYHAEDITESMKWNMEHEYYHLWNNEQLAETGGGGTSSIFSDEHILNQLGRDLSTYAADNDQEAAAESFVAWRNGYADKLPDEVVKFFRLKFGMAYEGVLV